MKRLPMSRRTFLRGTLAGVGVSLVLPPLEAMLDSMGAYAGGMTDEPIFGLFYWANGLPWNSNHGPEQMQAGYPDLWTPAQTGAGYQPSDLLMPLSAHKVTVATGLEPKTTVPPLPPGQEDGHMRGFMVAMTGDRIRPEGFDQPAHLLTALRPTLDQLVARHPSFYTTPPRFFSVEVGVSRARFHEFGHWNAISYNGPDSTNPPILDPGALYDRLFATPGDSFDLARRGRVLDAVLSDAKQKRATLGMSDRARLDAHLDHIRDIQKRLAASVAACTPPARPVEDPDLLKKTAVMAELLAIALGCGLTRVFSFMLTSPASTHVFSNLGAPDGMHKTCHDGRWPQIRDITRYQMQAFAVLLDELGKVTLPAGGTLLDRACILGTSEYGEGWKHSDKELPVVIAGGAGGRLHQNIHVREPGGNLCKAQLTVLRALGLPVLSFGFNGAETTDTLAGVLV